MRLAGQKTSADARANLTWRGRFLSVVSVIYNFYSSGDEVFEVRKAPGLFAGGLWHLERYAWQKQELLKGRTVLGVPVPGGTDWAGWGFSGEYSQSAANAAAPDNLRMNPVFRHHPATMFSSNITLHAQNEILAFGVPALSYAAGLQNFPLPDTRRNYDANAYKPNGWGRDDDIYRTRWLHSDLKNMAYFYTYQLFDELVSQGGLR